MFTETEYHNLTDLALMLNAIERRLERMEEILKNHCEISGQNENFKGDFVRNLETGLGGDYRGGSVRGYKGEREGGEKRGGKGAKIVPNEVSTNVAKRCIEIMAAYVSEIEAQRLQSAPGFKSAVIEVQKLMKTGYSEREIVQAVKDAANEPFWRKNFRSMLKLSRKNKDGVMYIDLFLALNQKNHKLPTNRPKIIV